MGPISQNGAGIVGAVRGATTEAQNVTPRCVANGAVDCVPAFNAAMATFSYSNGTMQAGGTIQLTTGTDYVSGFVVMAGRHGFNITGQTKLSTAPSSGAPSGLAKPGWSDIRPR
jgi:hypothetical protein